MLKRICDKCGRVIDRDENWFQMKCDKMNEGCVYCGAGIYELCCDCFSEFKTKLANNN